MRNEVMKQRFRVETHVFYEVVRVYDVEALDEEDAEYVALGEAREEWEDPELLFQEVRVSRRESDA